MRRTKIVATLGPATETPAAVKALIRAGVDVVRLNFSHGTADGHRKRAAVVREVAHELDATVAILGDLQGPKIRTEKFVDAGVYLQHDAEFILDMSLGPDEGTSERVGVTYKTLSEEVDTGDVLLLDDGRVILDVTQVSGPEIHTRVVNGGYLSDNKGINRRGGGLSAGALTDKDRDDIKLAAELDVDYLAVSFPRSAADIEEARELLEAAGGKAGIVAKIERAEAIDAIDEIIEASDVIMIARGDLGVEIGDAELPSIQKDLIRRARVMDTVSITATQMMESMIENQIPTRAEVFDVANAVLDGTDAVMLSGETAVGKNPDKVVCAMSDICEVSEQQGSVKRSDHRINTTFARVDEAIAMASMYVANQTDAAAIAALTESGSTTLWMSRISSGIPIYAMSGEEKTRRRVKLYRGVYPVDFPIKATSHAQANMTAVNILKQHKVVVDGDLVIITKGDLMGSSGGTNAMKIVEVGNMLEPVN